MKDEPTEPNPYRVREFVSGRGEPVVMLVKRCSGMPLFWPNVYATTQYANCQKSPRTTEKVLRTLAMAMLWAESLGGDLDQDLSTGAFLNHADAESLGHWMRLPVREQVRRSKLRGTLHKTGKLASLESYRRPSAKPDRNTRTVSDGEVGARLRSVVAYARFHLMRRVQSGSTSSGDGRFHKLAEEVLNRISDLAPSVPAIGDTDTKSGASPELINRIEEILDPSPENISNPWKDPFHRERNRLIFHVLYDTGGRRGEISPTQVADVSVSMLHLHIRESKTYPRTVPISRKTAGEVDVFLEKHWSTLSRKVRAHGHLFTTKQGRPLGNRQVDRIFEELRQKLALGVEGHVTPHTLRYTWNDRLSQLLDSLPQSHRVAPEMEKQMRNRLMGWSSNSVMAERYNRRHIKRSSDRLAQQLADKSSPMVPAINE